MLQLLWAIYKSNKLNKTTNNDVLVRIFKEILVKSSAVTSSSTSSSADPFQKIKYILAQFIFVLLIFINDFFEVCGNNEYVKVQPAIGQGIFTLTPIFAFMYLLNSIKTYTNFKQKQYIWAMDIFEGVLVFFLYNFAINFRNINGWNECVTMDQKTIQQGGTGGTNTGTGGGTGQLPYSDNIWYDGQAGDWNAANQQKNAWFYQPTMDYARTTNISSGGMNFGFGGGGGGGSSGGGGTGMNRTGIVSKSTTKPTPKKTTTSPKKDTKSSTDTTKSSPKKGSYALPILVGLGAIAFIGFVVYMYISKKKTSVQQTIQQQTIQQQGTQQQGIQPQQTHQSLVKASKTVPSQLQKKHIRIHSVRDDDTESLATQTHVSYPYQFGKPQSKQQTIANRAPTVVSSKAPSQYTMLTKTTTNKPESTFQFPNTFNAAAGIKFTQAKKPMQTLPESASTIHSSVYD